jgi:hypothetical protein
LGQIKQELPGLLIGEADAKPSGGRDKEVAQGTLLFHVEQIRETAQEVNSAICFYGQTEGG